MIQNVVSGSERSLESIIAEKRKQNTSVARAIAQELFNVDNSNSKLKIKKYFKSGYSNFLILSSNIAKSIESVSIGEKFKLFDEANIAIPNINITLKNGNIDVKNAEYDAELLKGLISNVEEFSKRNSERFIKLYLDIYTILVLGKSILADIDDSSLVSNTKNEDFKSTYSGNKLYRKTEIDSNSLILSNSVVIPPVIDRKIKFEDIVDFKDDFKQLLKDNTNSYTLIYNSVLIGSLSIRAFDSESDIASENYKDTSTSFVNFSILKASNEQSNTENIFNSTLTTKKEE